MAGRKPGKYLKIEPFRHPLSQDPDYPETTWKILESAIHEIHNQNASGLSFEELYRNAYNMVLHKHGDKLYNRLIKTLDQHLGGIAAQVEQAQGVQFLKELQKRWQEYQKSTQLIRDILMYMDRTYVTNSKKTPVYPLGMERWREVVVHKRSIHDRLLHILLDEIQKERTGEIIDRALLRSMTQMLMALGPKVYEQDFEQQFLQTSTEFFKAEAQQYLSTCACPEYLRKAEKRLNEEIERVQNYMDPQLTEPKITDVVQTQLIQLQMKALVEMEKSGLIPMLEDDKHDDLKRMYNLFKRVDGGLQLMRDMISAHVKEIGKALMQDPERMSNPVEFVQQLLDLREKYAVIIDKSFGSDRQFHQTLNQAFESFINTNARSPEYISLFMDEKLRKGTKGMSDEEIDKVMTIFRYLQEKDMFEKYYKQHLAKRLLSGRVVSDDAERNLLVRLKSECGYQFVSKLESMFKDIQMSRDTLQNFKGYLQDKSVNLGLELSVQVLTTGSWPFSQTQRCVLPAPLEQCCEHFTRFYLGAHSGRQLTWQTNMGTADIKAVFGGKQRHELNVSTYQMCILLLFNDYDRLTYQEIAQATEIPPADLKRNLQSLACVKGKNVLKKEPMSKDINENDVFTVNDNFSSKLHKVKISTVSAQRESEPEKQETRSRVEEDRKPQIEAAIVRIMKARRRLDHNSIISEVTRQLQSRFLPNPVVIKKRIESLIDREFLERDPHDRRYYQYLA